MKAVLLYSGGLDSTTILYALLAHNKQFDTIVVNSKDAVKKIELFPLMINYGQKHSAELHFAKQILQANKLTAKEYLIDWSSFRGQAQPGNQSAVHPHRNMMFMTIAFGYASLVGADTVYVGWNISDDADFPDCREKFLETFQDAIRLSADNKKLFLKAPLLKLNKAEILAYAQKYKVPVDKVWYCYRPQPQTSTYTPCGQCYSCRLMAEAKSKEVKVEGDLIL